MAQEFHDIQQTLAPPGAGLPVGQTPFLRFLFFPTYCHVTSWQKALAVFQAEGDRVIALTELLSDEHLARRVLIKAPLGIEDSSRYWSAEMVVEHLMEVGSRIAIGIVELTHGENVSVKTDIADVKPKGGNGPQILEHYREFLLGYAETLAEDVGDVNSKQTHSHPWFGELNAHQWACLGAVHQAIHRRQMERVIAELGDD